MKTLTERQQELIQLLSDGNFHSGEQIGVHLGISRAAISQQMKSLRQLGLEVFSITGKGYRLTNPIQLMDESVIQSGASEAPVHIHQVISSTNQVMMSDLDHWAKGECLLAETQTAGRGRRGRQWHSPFGSQYIMSMYWRIDQGPAAAMGLSLAIGVAVVKALESMGYQELGLKWPNDVYLKNRKLAGILVEMAAAVGGVCHLVIGTGINLQLPEELIQKMDQPCAHLAEQGITVDKNVFCIQMINTLREHLSAFETNGLSAFLNDWNRLDIFIDKPVKVIQGEQIIKGIYRGINEQGNMLLQLDDGSMKQFVGGEVSLRAD